MPGRRDVVLLRAATFFHFLSMGVFLSGLPLFLTRELDTSRAAVGLAVGAFSLTAVSTRPFVGRMVDRRGRKPFVSGAPALVAATSAALLLVTSFVGVVAIRLVQGVAGSAYYTSAATMATDLSPPERRADAISRFSLFLYAGFSVGPALGEWLIDAYDFRAAWLAALVAAVVAASLNRLVTETRPPRVDGAVAPRRLVHPAALGPGLVLATIAVGYTAIQSFAPLYARQIGMASSGALYATFAASIFVVRLASGRLADRYGRVVVALPGLAAGVVGMALLALVATPAAAFAGIALFGTAHALAFPSLMALTVDSVTEQERGEALGSFTACFDVGAAVGGYLVGAIADRAGFGVAWLAPAALCFLGALALMRIGHRVRREAARLAAAEPLPEPAGT